MLLNFKSLKSKHFVYSLLRYNKQIIERSLTNVKVQAPNLDSHRPEQIQHKWYELWQMKLKEFNNQEDRKIFTMLFPPPNVTGDLHLGHALTLTIQDAIVRYKLMNKNRVLWVPGFDHAGIATQVVVEKKLWNERKLTRHDLGRQKFIQEVFDWKNEKSKNIKNQMIKLNALSEWNYEYFTMDENISKSVNEAFIRLFDRGLIYRANRPINWCCSLKSTISDAEVENLQIKKRTLLKIPNYERLVEFGLIHRIAYKIKDSGNFGIQILNLFEVLKTFRCDVKDEEIVVATTRPETLFGDTAIAVNPLDSRYTRFHGKFAVNPLTDETIPIIVDSSVDSTFETGAVKITPCHDVSDYETGNRHKLKFKTIFDENGYLINVPDEFLKMPRFEARYKVIQKLKSLNLWRESKDHEMTLPTCSRTGDIIEPLLKEQWFVKSSEIFKICGDAVEDGRLKLIDEFRVNLWNHYFKSYIQKDWCISRQLWWGQQIPAYFISPQNDKNNKKWFVAHTIDEAKTKACEFFKTKDIEIQQDYDVFDTWFTSTILPLGALGWPYEQSEKKLPLTKIYPTDLLETGYDIMFFWAFRMVGMCYTLSGKLPFNQILFHGLIRDSEGRKMSKSLGNVIDPLDMVDGATLDELKKRILQSNLSEKEKKTSIQNQEKLYPTGIDAVGSDSTRIALLIQDFKSDNININPNMFFDSKRYCNKIWQAVRYFEVCTDSNIVSQFNILTIDQLIKSSKNNRFIETWILNQLVNTIKYVEENFDKQFNFHLVVKKLREFFYTDFCDFYLESTKPVFKQDNIQNNIKLAETVWNVLRVCKENALLMYHPFIPSITEELWQRSKSNKSPSNSSILDCPYPSSAKISKFQDDFDMKTVKEAINQVRTLINNSLNLKQLIQATEKPQVFVKIENPLLLSQFETVKKEIIHLARLSDLKINQKCLVDDSKSLNFEISKECLVTMVFENKINTEKVIDKLNKQLKKRENQLETLKKKQSEKSQDSIKKSDTSQIQECLTEIEVLKNQLEIFRQFKN